MIARPDRDNTDNGHARLGGQAGNPRGDKPSASLHATDVIWDFSSHSSDSRFYLR